MIVDVWTRRREMADADEHDVEEISGHEKSGV
jgi:hypothetical protein